VQSGFSQRHPWVLISGYTITPVELRFSSQEIGVFSSVVGKKSYNIRPI
jgi:hypothetical protein